MHDMPDNLRAEVPARLFRRAAALAILLHICAGLAFFVLQRRLEAHAAPPMPPGTLARLPMNIGTWIGQDAPLSEDIIKATDTDDHVSRTYRRSSDNAAVGCWIGYGTRARDLMPHRPEVCYVGQGWTQQDTRTED